MSTDNNEEQELRVISSNDFFEQMFSKQSSQIITLICELELVAKTVPLEGKLYFDAVQKRGFQILLIHKELLKAARLARFIQDK